MLSVVHLILFFALIVLQLGTQLVAFEPLEEGAAESALGEDGADETDSSDDVLIEEHTHPISVELQGSPVWRIADGPDEPPPALSDRPPNA